MMGYTELIQTEEYWKERIDNSIRRIVDGHSEADDEIKYLVDSIQGLIKVLRIENEVGVSDSSSEHVGLPHVRKRHASDEPDKSSDESEQITLGKIIDDEKECNHKSTYQWLKASGKPQCPCFHCGIMVTRKKSS